MGRGRATADEDTGCIMLPGPPAIGTLIEQLPSGKAVGKMVHTKMYHAGTATERTALLRVPAAGAVLNRSFHDLRRRFAEMAYGNT